MVGSYRYLLIYRTLSQNTENLFVLFSHFCRTFPDLCFREMWKWRIKIKVWNNYFNFYIIFYKIYISRMHDNFTLHQNWYDSLKMKTKGNVFLLFALAVVLACLYTRCILLLLWGIYIIIYVVVTFCVWINDRLDSLSAVCGCRWLVSTVWGESLTESAYMAANTQGL